VGNEDINQAARVGVCGKGVVLIGRKSGAVWPSERGNTSGVSAANYSITIPAHTYTSLANTISVLNATLSLIEHKM
jgi:hypothetical protein